MTDEELQDALTLGDEYLNNYKRVLEPVLVELAKRKEETTGFEYTGEFGCEESGMDELCIHMKDGQHLPRGNHSPYDWLSETQEQFFSKLDHINLGGHF